MLGDEGMLGIGKKYAPSTNTFQEDVTAFIVTKEDVGRKMGVTISGKVKEAGPDWIGVSGGKPDGLPGYTRLMGNKIKITEGPGAGQVRRIAADNAGWTGDPPPVVKCTVDPKWDVVPVAKESVYQVLGYQEADIGRAQWGGDHAVDPTGDNPSFFQGYSQMNKSAWVPQVLDGAAAGAQRRMESAGGVSVGRRVCGRNRARRAQRKSGRSLSTFLVERRDQGTPLRGPRRFRWPDVGGVPQQAPRRLEVGQVVRVGISAVR